MNKNLCECCTEHPVWSVAAEHGYALCEACASDTTCSTCDKDSVEEHFVWDSGECEECHRLGEAAEWKDKTEAAVKALAAKHGWSCMLKSIAQTGSMYYDLLRDLPGDEIEMITVRISDHSTAYCSEDVSLSMHEGGDDHTIEYLERRLSRMIATE